MTRKDEERFYDNIVGYFLTEEDVAVFKKYGIIGLERDALNNETPLFLLPSLMLRQTSKGTYLVCKPEEWPFDSEGKKKEPIETPERTILSHRI